MLKGLGFILGVLLSAAFFFTLSGKGGQILHPIMASVQSPFKETGIPGIQGFPASKENDDKAVVPDETLPELVERKNEPSLPVEIRDPDPLKIGRSNPAPVDTDTPPDIQSRHFKLWSPFHSMRAAQGFADRLANVAEVPVDVQRTGSGRFQVMLLYQSEPERLAAIERIEGLTGLKIQQGRQP